MTPDARFLHRPDPYYLRRLIRKSGMTQLQVAKQLGMSDRTLRAYLAPRHVESAMQAPYVVQFAIEHLEK